MFKRANKRKKNLILPLNFIKVKYKHFQNKYRYTYIMPFKLVNLLFILSVLVSFSACTSDENALSLGTEAINDNHNAQYTEDFDINTETLLAEYVLTNNTGTALCGSYNDDYIGKITTNTVFKFSPNIQNTDSWYTTNFKKTGTLDSIVVFLYTNGYIYGDSTKTVTLALHALTENYDLDTADLTNYTTTPYNSTPLCTKSFIPEDIKGDTLSIKIPAAIAQEWFDSIQVESDNYVINAKSSSVKSDTDEKFIENVIPGLTIRNVGDNNAIIGFKMPTSNTTDFTSTSTLRMYFTTQYPLTEHSVDFKIYEPDHQYNQISADFSQGVLAGIEAGGDGIPSSETNGMTFVQSGIGLMTKIEIPTLNKLFIFGNNVTILDLDLNFSAVPYSFSNFLPLPTQLYLDRLKKNGDLDSDGVLDIDGKSSSIYSTSSSKNKMSYGASITRYGMDEQLLLNDYAQTHTALLISPLNNMTSLPTVNRLVIGDEDCDDCEMNAAMYYTTFE